MATRIEAAGRTAAERVAVGLVVGGAVLVVISGFVVWLEVLGSELTGYRLAEIISDFGDDLPGVPPRWVGAAWYGFPALAAVCWLLAFRRSPASASQGHTAIGLVLVVASLAYLVSADVQAGPILTLCGGIAVLAGGLIQHRA